MPKTEISGTLLQQGETEPSAVPVGYMTRTELIDRAGLTVAEFNTLRGRNIIKSEKRNTYNWALYTEADLEKARNYAGIRVERLRRTDRGAEYSVNEGLLVMNRLKVGMPLDDIFVETRIHPSIVSTIARDYEKMSGAVLLPKHVVEAMRELPIEGNFKTAQDILKAFEKASSEHKCASCKRKPRSRQCVSCCIKKNAPSTKKANGAEESGVSVEEEALTG